jgi:hypothetical protein
MTGRRLDGSERPTTPAAATTVWIAPSATSYSCLCETCLEDARRSGALFSDALFAARVSGELSPDVAGIEVRCAAGHPLVLRRGERPPALVRHDERQLQLR